MRNVRSEIFSAILERSVYCRVQFGRHFDLEMDFEEFFLLHVLLNKMEAFLWRIGNLVLWICT
jgi:hypothetical protein